MYLITNFKTAALLTFNVPWRLASILFYSVYLTNLYCYAVRRYFYRIKRGAMKIFKALTISYLR